MGEVRLNGGKSGQMAFQTRASLQNQAIGWLRKGCSSLGGGTLVQFPRIWRASGECRIKSNDYRFILTLSLLFDIRRLAKTANIALLALMTG